MSRDELAQSMPCKEEEGEAKHEGEANVRILPHKNIFLSKSPTFPTPGKENPNKTWQSRVKDWV